MGCREHTGFVGRPSRAAGCDHPVGTVFLENGRGFVFSAGSHAGVTPCMIQIIVGQFCDVQGEVFFRREDVVSFSVIIHKNSLVACHLSAFKVALHVKSLSHGFLPLCRPISRIERGYIGGCDTQ